MFGKISSFEPGRFSPFRVILFFILCTVLVVQAGVPCLAAPNDDNLTKVAIFGPDYIASMVAGTGMIPSGSGVFTADVPGEVIAGYLYVLSHDLIKNGIQFPKGDEDVHVQITSNVGFNEFFTVPVKYKAKAGAGQKLFVNVMEVTPYIDQGLNTFDVSGMDVDQANGAGVVIIYRDLSESYKTIKVTEGLDFAFYTNDPPTGPDTEAYIFRFAPTSADRQATFKALIGDALDFRGDEAFAYTRPGRPSDSLKDRDGDGRRDITRRDRNLRLDDFLPLGNDPANRRGKKEAQGGAISLEEDLIGVAEALGGFSRGPQLDVFVGDVTIPAGNKYVAFQFQSENPENGDSFQVAAGILELEAPLATVGDFVWLDESNDGIQDPGELGIAGVTVDIACDTDGDQVEDYFDSTVTDADGLYLFTLDPIADGNCRVTVDQGSGPLSGMDPTTPTETNTGTLDEYEADLDNDFGFWIPLAPGDTVVGDFVWLDYNCDGIQDDGEPGIENISVRTVAGPPAQDETQVTSSEGLYLQTVIIDDCLDPAAWPAATITVDTNDPDLPAGAIFSTPTSYSIGPLQCQVPNLDNDFGVCIPGEIEIVKTASGETFYPGETVTYTYTVTNTGPVDLTNVVVTDNRIPDLGPDANIGDLAAGETVSFDFSITVPECGTSGDGFSDEKCEGTTYEWEAGCYLRNRADVTGTDPTGGEVSDWDIACIGILDPDIEIVKVPSGETFYPGETVTYTYTVINIGDVDLTNVVVTDNRIPDLGPDANIGDLAAGETVSFDFSITVPECGTSENGFSKDKCEDASYEWEAGCYLRNRADVTGDDPKGSSVSDFDTACIGILDPGIEIIKTASDETFYPGDTVTYTYTVTNTGDVDLHDVVVTDNRIPDLGGEADIGDLAVGQTVGFDFSITVPECGLPEDGFSQEPCEDSSYTGPAGCYLRNTGYVTGKDPRDTVVNDDDPACITILCLSEIGDTVFEDLNNNGFEDPGEPGIGGVTVELYDATGTILLASTTTDINGYYLFSNLRAGTYVVDPIGPPEYILTTGNDPMEVVLGACESFLDADFGYWYPCGACEGKISELTLRYDGSVVGANIVVETRSAPKFDDPIFFDGTVNPGELFDIMGKPSSSPGFDGTVGTEIDIYVDGVLNTSIHTSCSQEIGPGFVSGDFTIIRAVSSEGGLLCPVD